MHLWADILAVGQTLVWIAVYYPTIAIPMGEENEANQKREEEEKL